MPDFDLKDSIARAEQRFGDTRSRRPRKDRGRRRLHPDVAARLQGLLEGQDRPPVRTMLADLDTYCKSRGLRRPARATIYKWMDERPPRLHAVAHLPPHVRETLYNLGEDGSVPGHQLAFHCLNYGGLQAVSFAAGLPWLDLHQAANLRGWRPRSRGLLEAICRVRGI